MRVGVIGAGILGLTAAYELLKQGHQVAVFERGPEVGGQVATTTIGGGRIERYYHHLFTNDRHIRALANELGLGGTLAWLPSKVGFLGPDGRIRNFTSPFDLLRFSPLSPVDRVRLGLVTLRLRRDKDWRKYEGITARDWITRHLGARTYETMWGPLLRGKFGEHFDRVSMAWFWGKIHLRFASREGGIFSRELLGYPIGSFGQIIERLAERVTELGGQIYAGTPVTRVLVEEGRIRGVEVGAGQGPEPGSAGTVRLRRAEPGPHRFDRVLATIPSYAFRALVPTLPDAYDRRLREVDYLGAMCVLLALKHPLSQIYWLNISDRAIPFVGVIEQTNLVGPEHYGGRHVVYLSNYLAKDQDLWTCSHDEVLERYLPHLRRINPAFELDWVEERQVARVEAAQPVISCNYSDRIPDLRTPIPGLYLANTTQIYPEDRGTNYSVRLAQNVVAEMVQDAR